MQMNISVFLWNLKTERLFATGRRFPHYVCFDLYLDNDFIGSSRRRTAIINITTRFYNHRSCMKNYKRNILLYDQFCGPGHEMSYCKVQIIFHGKTDDDDTKDVLLAKEEYYMRMLSTLYPFGLKDNVKSLNINLKTYDFTQFSITIKSSPHFLFTRMVICLRVTVQINSLNLYIKPHGHVHTGDLRLIKNIALSNIMKMGAKFRETPPCCYVAICDRRNL